MEMKDRMREIMESRKLSQKDFAQLLEISPGSLSSIFSGRTGPTNNHTQAIHKAFPDISINWLLFGEGEMLRNDNDSTLTSNAPEVQKTGAYGGDLFESKVPTSPSKTSPVSPEINPANARAIIEVLNANKSKNEPLKRQVKEIRVFFDDGTYETFVSSSKS